MSNTGCNQALFLVALGRGAGEVSVESNFRNASSRLQLMPAITAAKKLDLKPRVLSVGVDKPGIINDLGMPRVCIIDKCISNQPELLSGFSMALLSILVRLKNQGTAIIVTYSDHHSISQNIAGALYRDLLQLSDVVVTPCEAMAKAVDQFITANQSCMVIEDPWQVKQQAFLAWKPCQPLKLAWFGNPTNANYLCELFKDLKTKANGAQKYELSVVTRADFLPKIEHVFKSIPARAPWNLCLTEWQLSKHPDQIEQLLGASHICLLPSDPNNIKKVGVSHNRLVDSIRSGCITIASPMESYKELSKVALLSSNFVETLNRVLPDYERLSKKYTNLRKEQLARFAPDRNLQKWQNLLSSFA